MSNLETIIGKEWRNSEETAIPQTNGSLVGRTDNAVGFE
jgi:hypothetical protein